jgi:hypothetical protein
LNLKRLHWTKVFHSSTATVSDARFLKDRKYMAPKSSTAIQRRDQDRRDRADRGERISPRRSAEERARIHLHGDPTGELSTERIRSLAEVVPRLEDPQYQLQTHQPLINLGFLIAEQIEESSETAEETTDGSGSMSDGEFKLDTWDHEQEYDTVLEDVCSDDVDGNYTDSGDDDYECFEGNASRCIVCKATVYGIPNEVQTRLDEYDCRWHDQDAPEIINEHKVEIYCYRCHIAYPEHMADAVVETVEAYDETFGRTLRLRREFCVRLELKFIPVQHHEFPWYHLSEDGTSLAIVRGVRIERRTRLPTHVPQHRRITWTGLPFMERIRCNWEDDDARETLR